MSASPDRAYWETLAGDYVRAYGQVFGVPPTRHTLLLAMAVAEFETLNGRAWPGTFNFGAVQLRGLTDDELARFHAGTLKAGDRFPGNPGGVLHVDTHPPAVPYPVWFAAFPTQVDGVRYFLKTLFRAANEKAVAANPNGSPQDLATAMYLNCYFEGSHAGARPCGKRALPLTKPEQDNVDAYAGAITSRMTALDQNLAGWDVPQDRPTMPDLAHAALDEATVQLDVARDDTSPE